MPACWTCPRCEERNPLQYPRCERCRCRRPEHIVTHFPRWAWAVLAAALLAAAVLIGNPLRFLQPPVRVRYVPGAVKSGLPG